MHNFYIYFLNLTSLMHFLHWIYCNKDSGRP